MTEKIKKKRMLDAVKLGAFAVTAVLTLASCAANESESAPDAEGVNTNLVGSLVGAGASSQGEAQNSWIASFTGVQPEIQVNYDPAGSGAGRENFQQGASTFAGSDRAFKIEEIQEGVFETCSPQSGLVQLPLYVSPIAVVFNLEGIETLNLDPASLAKIFTGEINNWSDDEIVKQNVGTQLPDLDITPVHRADKSGTTGNFTDYLAAAAPSDWEYGSVEEWPLSNGEAAPQTSGVVNAVSNGQGTIGYVDASRSAALGKVSVKVGAEYIGYSPEAAAAVLDASDFESGRSAGDLAISLNRAPDAEGVYPIVLVSYLIGCETYDDPATAELVSAYFEFVASSQGQELAAEHAGSAPISEALRAKVEEAIALIS